MPSVADFVAGAALGALEVQISSWQAQHFEHLQWQALWQERRFAHWSCRFRGSRSTLSTFRCRARGRRSTLCTGTADFSAGAALEPRSADCVAGAVAHKTKACYVGMATSSSIF